MSNEAVTKILEIKIKYDDAIKRMAEYQKNIQEASDAEKQMKQQLKDGLITREEYNRELSASQQYIRTQLNASQQLSRQIQNQIKVEKESEGSLVQLRAKLSSLTQAYDDLSEAERNGSKGDALRKQITETTDTLKTAEAATQRFYRNVGNYPDAVKGASEAMKNLQNEVKSLKEQLSHTNKDMNPEAYADLEKKLSDVTDRMKELKEASSGIDENLQGNVMIGTLLGNVLSSIGDSMMDSVGHFKELAEEGVNMAMEADGIVHAFDNLNRPDLLQGLRKSTHGAVNDVELMKAAVQFKDFNLPLDQLGKFLEFAQKKAQDTGQSMDYLVQSIVLGLGRKSPQILDNLGISASEIQEKMKSTGDMTSAVAEIINKQMVEAGDHYSSSAERAAQRTVRLENAQRELGEVLLPMKEAWSDVFGDFEVHTIEVIKWMVEHKGVVGALTVLISGLTVVTAFQSRAITENIIVTKAASAAHALWGNVMTSFKGIALLASAAISAITGNTIRANAAMKLFNTTCKASTIGLIVTAIIAAGVAIAAFVGNMDSTSKKESELQKSHAATAAALQQQNRQITEDANKRVAGQITAIKSLKQTMEDSTKSYSQRKNAILNLQKIIPGFHASISKEGNLFHSNSVAIDNYVKKLQRAALAEAAYAKMVDNQKAILDAEETKRDANNKKRIAQNAMRSQGFQKGDKVVTQTTYAGTNSAGIGNIYSSKAVIDKNGQQKKMNADRIEKDQKFIDNFNDRISMQDDIIKQRKAQNNWLQKVIDKNGGVPDSTMFNPIQEDKNLGSGGGTSSRSNAGSENDEKQHQQEIAKIVSEGQEALTKLISDNLQRQRQETSDQYNNQIDDLRKKLETEKSLTEDAKKAINNKILALEHERDEKLEELYMERYNKIAEEDAKILEMKIKNAKKGSEERYKLEKEQRDENYEKEYADLDQKIEEQQSHITAIEAEYQQSRENGATALELDAINQRKDIELALLDDYHKQKAEISEQQRQEDASAEDDYQNEVMDRNQKIAENEIAEMSLKVDRTKEEQEAILEARRDADEQYIEQLEERGQMENQTVEEYNEELLAAKQKYADDKKSIDDYEVECSKAKYEAEEAVTNSLIKLTSAIGESNTAFAKISKIMTLAQIAIDTGRAISSGIASASSLPYPANLVAIATTVATVIANIATAISTVNSAKFAEGGIVDGHGKKNRQDQVTVRVNDGEMLLNEEEQSNLHKRLTGKPGAFTPTDQKELFGFAKGTIKPVSNDYQPVVSSFRDIGSSVPFEVNRINDSVSQQGQLADQIIQGVGSMPAPVVSVEDINQGQRRVEVINNIDTL